MAAYDREELAKLDDDAIAAALAPLSWPAIRDRIAHMDYCATGGVHPDATLIAALVLRVCRQGAALDGMNCTAQIAHALEDGGIADSWAYVFEDALRDQNAALATITKQGNPGA